MRMCKLAATAALVGAASLAQANVSVSTAGNTTTYTENFNGGTSFSGGGWFNAPGADDFLWLSSLAPVASFSFTAAANIASLTLSFWYSGPSPTDNGTVSLNLLSAPLGNTPGNALQFLLNNPGPATGGRNNWDAPFSSSLSNLAAGDYTLSFATGAGYHPSLKVDDVVLSVTAVPEPAALALALAGLAVVGVAVGRRKRG